jgi:hypothetical protein
LYKPVTYEIRVPEHLDHSWSDWAEGMKVAFESKGEGPSVTTLTDAFDQATLKSLLRCLDYLGLPLISVICVECAIDG